MGDTIRSGNSIQIRVTPKKFPEEKFDYYSIPAYDAGQISIATYGDDIQSSKFLLQEKCVLLSKLNPRIVEFGALMRLLRDDRSLLLNFYHGYPKMAYQHISFTV